MPTELLHERPSATALTEQVCPHVMLVMSHPVSLVLHIYVCPLEHSSVVKKDSAPLPRDQDTLAVLLPQFILDWIFSGGHGAEEKIKEYYLKVKFVISAPL